MPIILEVCIDSIESAIAAADGGADRLEVCSSLAAGGTTPSLGLVGRCLAEVPLPVMMMIRPHDGDFSYQPKDIEVMLADIKAAHTLGVHGVVLGALTPERRVDIEVCQRLLAAARPLSTTFHRAIDVVEDPEMALEQIIELGFDRVLTSGQAAHAVDGVSVIRRLHELAKQRITILPGAGVNAANAQHIVSTTGVSELHSSASCRIENHLSGDVTFGADHRVTQADLVRSIKQAVQEV